MLQLFICIVLILLLLRFPQIAHDGAEYGLAIFLDTLLPYFLPIIILSNWLLSLSSVGGTNKVALYTKSYILSAVGGYPTGAILLSKLVSFNSLSKKEAAFLLPVLHFPNPLFVLGFFGLELAQNIQIGIYYLLTIHLIAIGSLFFIFKRFQREQPNVATIKRKASLPDALKESILPLSIVGITIIFFTTVASVTTYIMQDSTFISKSIHLLTVSFLEITNGLILAHEYYPSYVFILFSIFILTTQSLSIHMQVAIIAKQASISLKPYLFYRTAVSIILPVIFFIFLK